MILKGTCSPAHEKHVIEFIYQNFMPKKKPASKLMQTKRSYIPLQSGYFYLLNQEKIEFGDNETSTEVA